MNTWIKFCAFGMYGWRAETLNITVKLMMWGVTMIRTAITENGGAGIEAADPRITAFKGIPFAAPPVG